MRPTTNPIVMGLVTAYCALASPTNNQPDHVQEVKDTLKAQLETDNVTDASAMIDEAEAALVASGVLNDYEVAKLNQQIDFLISEGVSVHAIVEWLMESVTAHGALKKPNQDEAATPNDAIFLDADVIKQVVDHGVNYDEHCPDGSQAKLCGCVIL